MRCMPDVLKRLNAIAEEATALYLGAPNTQVRVSLGDLVALLEDYDRLDGEARLSYPPHVQRATEELQRASAALAELERALSDLRSRREDMQKRRAEQVRLGRQT